MFGTFFDFVSVFCHFVFPLLSFCVTRLSVFYVFEIIRFALCACLFVAVLSDINVYICDSDGCRIQSGAGRAAIRLGVRKHVCIVCTKNDFTVYYAYHTNHFMYYFILFSYFGNNFIGIFSY